MANEGPYSSYYCQYYNAAVQILAETERHENAEIELQIEKQTGERVQAQLKDEMEKRIKVEVDSRRYREMFEVIEKQQKEVIKIKSGKLSNA
jgi:hypothetical protein